MRALFLSGLVFSAFVLGCSGADSTNGSGGGGPNQDPNALSFETGKFVAPTGESFTCFYLDAKTPKELSVTGASGVQSAGGHHLLLYYTDVPREPTHHTCVDSEMVNWHQIAGAAGQADMTGAEGIINLPEGLAIKIPAGKQLVMQSHYINGTGKPETVDDSLTLHLIDPADVKMYANSFANSFEGFVVQPNSSLTQTSVCTVPRDMSIAVMIGHEHEWGKRFTLALQSDDGTSKTLYSEAWQPLYATHPPVQYYPLDKPLSFKAGQKLVQTCEWQNPTPSPLSFPDEMCVGFLYYYPDAGDLYCNPKAMP